MPFVTPTSKTKKNNDLTKMVEESVESTTQEENPGEQHEFSHPDDMMTMPLADVSNQNLPIARKSNGNLAKMINPPWAISGEKRKKSPVAQVTKKTRVSPSPSTSGGGDTGDGDTEKNNLYGWRRNFGLLVVVSQINKAIEEQKVPFNLLRFSTSVYQPLIEAGVIQVDSTMNAKKISDSSTVLKTRIKTILNKFEEQKEIPARVCPPEDRRSIVEELQKILNNNKLFEGNTRATIKHYEGSGSSSVGQTHIGEYRVPKNPRNMPGYIDREQGALQLAASVPEGESEDEDESGVEEDLLAVANGDKTKTAARGSRRSSIHPAVETFLEKSTTNQETSEQLLIEGMNSREEFQAKQLKLVEKKNEISEQRNKMIEKLLPPNKEISITAVESKFSECIELASIEQVKEEVSEYLGINSNDVSGLLRSFASHPSSNNANGQKVTRVNQLFNEEEIEVSAVDISGDLYIKFRTN